MAAHRSTSATVRINIVDIRRPITEVSPDMLLPRLLSWSLNSIAGILHPGFKAAGFRIHCRRFAGVFGTAPEAIVSRLIRWVRSGPKRPSATVPATVWQLMQAVVSKIFCPADTASSACAG